MLASYIGLVVIGLKPVITNECKWRHLRLPFAKLRDDAV